MATKGDSAVVSTGGGVFVTVNGGTNWSSANNGLPPTTSTFGFTSFIYEGTKIIAGSTNGIYISYDHGQNWTTINTGLTNMQVKCLLSTSNSIFAGTSSGVFLMQNLSGNWINYSSGLPSISIKSLASLNNEIYCATEGKGVWKNSVSEITTFNSKFYKPSNDVLVFPNPAQKILQTNTNSSYKIYDVLGNLCLSGDKSDVINVESLKSGVYFIELSSLDSTKKIRFVKD